MKIIVWYYQQDWKASLSDFKARASKCGEKGEMNMKRITKVDLVNNTYSDMRTNSESDYISIFGHQDIFKVLEVLIKYNSYKAELMFAL